MHGHNPLPRPFPPRPAWLCGLLLLLCSVVAAEAGNEQGAGKSVTPRTPAEDVRAEATKTLVYGSLSAADQADFVKLGSPQPYENMARELPQTFERYAAIEVRSRPSEKRRTIVLQPLGEFSREQRKLLEPLRDYAEVFFNLPVRLEESIELKVDDPKIPLTRQVPMGQRRVDYTRQFDASVILREILAKRVPDDALVYVGLTAEDLFVGKLTYVFGLASYTEPVTVFSLRRYEPEFSGGTREAGAEVLVLRRAMKVLNHECSHLFGLRHCLFYRCTMNYSNSLGDLDVAPIHLCPVCHRKLRWSLNWDASKRYDLLGQFYREYGLEAEAQWLLQRSAHWGEVVRREELVRVQTE